MDGCISTQEGEDDGSPRCALATVVREHAAAAAAVLRKTGGWLDKKGGFRKNWNRRWFMLQNDCLIYKKEESGGNVGSIPVSSIQEARRSTFESASKQARPFEIELVTKERTYRFMAADEQNRTAWLTVLQQEVRVHLHHCHPLCCTSRRRH